MSSNIVSSLGAGSGIDITSLVSQLVEVERAPTQARIDKRQETLKAQISGYGQMRSALDELQSSIDSLGDNDLFKARAVSVPSSDVITANKVKPGAQTGSYKINVLDVASAQSLVMGSQADSSAALKQAGQMTIRFGAWDYDDTDAPESFTANGERPSLTIDIDESDSLDTIAEKINEQDAGVQASVLQVDGTYQLMLTSPSGESNAMEISTDGTLSGFAFTAASHAGVTETQQAQDARLTVNGLEVTRETNDIDDVISGFDFTINKASEGESLTFSITADKASAEEAIRGFVDAYNAFQETAGKLVGYSRNEDNELTRGDLATDGSAKTMVNRLRQMIGGSVPGAESGFTALTNVGIRTELDGTLSIDEDEFSNAISSQFNLLEGLFATQTSSTNSAVTVKQGTYGSEAVAGSYQVVITQDPTHGKISGTSMKDTAPGFATGDDSFSPALTASAAGGYSFKIKVDGVESDLIELNGTYNNADELRADLQARINGDAKLKAANLVVDVGFDATSDSLSFASRSYGGASKVSFTDAGTGMNALGISTALTGTAGTDVAGTINGVAGFGAGNVLLPDLDSDAYGLNLVVEEGASADTDGFEINFSRGFAGELYNLIDDFLGSTGVIGMREDTIESQLEDLDEEQLRLDTRMEKVSVRLTTQFSLM